MKADGTINTGEILRDGSDVALIGTGRMTAEEASVIGGLGSAVAETLVRRYPVRQEFVGIQDTFGESGSSADLLKKYGLTAADIVAAAHKARET